MYIIKPLLKINAKNGNYQHVVRWIEYQSSLICMLFLYLACTQTCAVFRMGELSRDDCELELGLEEVDEAGVATTLTGI